MAHLQKASMPLREAAVDQDEVQREADDDSESAGRQSSRNSAPSARDADEVVEAVREIGGVCGWVARPERSRRSGSIQA